MTVSDQLIISTVTALFSILVAVATAFLTYFGFWRQAKAELHKELDTRYNQRKWDVYVKFTKILHLILRIEFYEDTQSDDVEDLEARRKLELELHDEVDLFIGEMLLIGSKEVIEKFYTWYFDSPSITLNFEKSTKNLVDLLNAMREDLGKNKSDIDYTFFDGTYYISEKKATERKKEIELNQKASHSTSEGE